MPHSKNHSQSVLITGSAKRIGRAIAKDFAARGWKVAVHYRGSREEADELVRQIKSSGGHAAAVQADLTKEEDVERLVPLAIEKLGTLTCLVNNASLFDKDEVSTVDAGSWYAHLDVNVKVPIFLSQALAKALPGNVQGNIVNIIDQRVWKLNPLFFSYTVSKSALWTATRLLAQALAPRIRVNAIGPGPVLQSIHQSGEQFARQEKATLLERGTTPQEISQAIQFILNAPAMTGQMIALDGGQHLNWKTPDIVDVEQ